MTTAEKATQAVVTCQQLPPTGQGSVGTRGGGGYGACSAQPVQVTVAPQRAALALHPCPSGKDLRRFAGAGALARSLQGASTWTLGPHGPLPFAETSAWNRLPSGWRSWRWVPRDPGQKIQSQLGSGGASCWKPRALKAPTYLNPLTGQTLPIPLILALRPSKAV